MDQKSGVLRKAAYVVLNEITDFVYPRRCPVCDGIVKPGLLICRECRGKIKTVSEPVCKQCGKPLQNERQEYCGDCRRKKHIFCQGKAVFVYEGRIKQSMYRFKYGGKREYALYYAKEAARLYERWIIRHGIEAIVPVPMYFLKKRRRGYNQAEVFAKALGRETGLPVEARMVKRVRSTVPQKELSDAERRCNLKNAFQSDRNIVNYKQILLVDDIYTTGSTMDAVGEVLLSAGAEHVYYICISIGAGY